jgi:hypothetical protein
MADLGCHSQHREIHIDIDTDTDTCINTHTQSNIIESTHECKGIGSHTLFVGRHPGLSHQLTWSNLSIHT